MQSLALLLTLSLTLPVVPPDQDQGQPPDAAAVKAAVEELENAFSKGQAPERIEAMRKHAELVHADVIEAVAKGLRDDAPEVQTVAVETLRFMAHPAAFKALVSTYKRDKKLRKNDELFLALLKAIGQHGQTDAIAILTDDPFTSKNSKTIQARILGLANIRDPRSVEELVGLMRMAGRHRVQPYMNDFRLALMVLTGVDKGKGQDAWMSWWNDNKKTFEVTPKAPALPKLDQRRWDYFWGNEMKRERTKKRGDRGDDPEDGE